MSARRWNSPSQGIFEWMEDADLSIEDLLLPSIFTKLQKKEEPQKVETHNAPVEGETVKYPDELPILPLRGVVVYPSTAVPLTIGQPRSIQLVDEVAATTDKLVGLVAARDPELENPGSADLYSIGTIATVHRLFRAPDNTIRLLVQGLVRFRLQDFIQEQPYLKARIQLLPETVETGLEIDALARSARDQFEQISSLTPSIPRELVTSISTL